MISTAKLLEQIIESFDPIGVVGEVEDEYEPEAKMLVSDLSGTRTLEDVTNVVFRVFKVMFDEEFAQRKNLSINIAKKIFSNAQLKGRYNWH